jgi:hypothetical protein
MSDLMRGTSGYATGAIDTATTQIDEDPDPLKGEASATKLNGVASAVVQIETALGVATDLHGSKQDLVERLSIAVEANGKLKDFSSANKTTFPVSIAEGGTGATALTDTQAVYISGSSMASTYGFLFHGPSSFGSGSSSTYGGDAVIASSASLSGIQCYTSFTLNSGVTLGVPFNGRRLIIIAAKRIDINGTINAVGAGAPGGAAGTAGSQGTDQAGGNGGASDGAGAGGGGSVVFNGMTLATAGSALAGGSIPCTLCPALAFGGAGGGGGDAGSSGTGGTGGAGGASVVLIAPIITFGAGAVLNTSGGPGGAGTGISGPGGGGGSGNAYLWCRSYTAAGNPFVHVGGSPGAPGSAAAGVSGSSGAHQILIWG